MLVVDESGKFSSWSNAPAVVLDVECNFHTKGVSIVSWSDQLQSLAVLYKLGEIIFGKRNEAIRVLDLLNCYGLIKTINFSTRYGNCIDNIFINFNANNNCNTYKLQTGLSDHDEQVMLSGSLHVHKSHDVHLPTYYTKR